MGSKPRLISGLLGRRNCFDGGFSLFPSTRGLHVCSMRETQLDENPVSCRLPPRLL